MELNLTGEYVRWANGESGEVAIKVNGITAFRIPVQFDASPVEPQVEHAVREWLHNLAISHGALSW